MRHMPGARGRASNFLYNRAPRDGTVIGAFVRFFVLHQARVAALRKAFDATMKNPAYLAEAKNVRLRIRPTNAAELTAVINGIVNAPPDIIKKAQDAVKRRKMVKCKSVAEAKYRRSPRKKKKKKS